MQDDGRGELELNKTTAKTPGPIFLLIDMPLESTCSAKMDNNSFHRQNQWSSEYFQAELRFCFIMSSLPHICLLNYRSSSAKPFTLHGEHALIC
jgi:hypothetical protein